jgi:hypothetical protein
MVRRNSSPSLPSRMLIRKRRWGRPATVGSGVGTRLWRVLLRWQAPQPCPAHRRYCSPGPASGPRPLRESLRRPPAYPSPPMRRVRPGYAPSWGQSAAKTAADWPPSGGVERPRRVVRFTRLMQRRSRAFWRTCGPRRLRRQSQPVLAAMHGDTADVPCSAAGTGLVLRCSQTVQVRRTVTTTPTKWAQPSTDRPDLRPAPYFNACHRIVEGWPEW